MEEKSKEIAHAVQGRASRYFFFSNFKDEQRCFFFLFGAEKAAEVAVSTKEAVVTGEKVVEEKLHAAKETVAGTVTSTWSDRRRSFPSEKSHAVVDTVKETAHAASVKAVEVEKAAEEKLIIAEKTGKENVYIDVQEVLTLSISIQLK